LQSFTFSKVPTGERTRHEQAATQQIDHFFCSCFAFRWRHRLGRRFRLGSKVPTGLFVFSSFTLFFVWASNSCDAI
jgi:hypothetical protein